MRQRSVVRGRWGGAIPPWIQCVHNALTENVRTDCDGVAPRGVMVW
nr:MAG TPA: hypothetical protein [Caudoviricetes sp.]